MIPEFQQKDLQEKTPSLEEKGFPGGSAFKIVFPRQEAQVRSLVRELDLTFTTETHAAK